jgi:hypothetical protein
MTRGRVAMVTCRALPEPDPDEGVLQEALRRAGLAATLAAWDDPGVDWSGFDLAVLRSCWDYHHRPEAFAAWVDRAAGLTRFLNPAPVVRWNLHKGYLKDLQAAGVAIVPTAFVGRGAEPDVPGLLRARGWDDVVIKPCVSAGSARTRRFAADSLPQAGAFLRSITHTGDAMIQPFIPSVTDGGERSAVWIHGRATHAIIKHARFEGQHERVSEALPVLEAERALLHAAAPLMGEGCLYARLDTMRDRDGSLLVSELELIEPSLFLLQSPEALTAFVQGVCDTLGQA